MRLWTEPRQAYSGITAICCSWYAEMRKSLEKYEEGGRNRSGCWCYGNTSSGGFNFYISFPLLLSLGLAKFHASNSLNQIVAWCFIHLNIVIKEWRERSTYIKMLKVGKVGEKWRKEWEGGTQEEGGWRRETFFTNSSHSRCIHVVLSIR